MTKNKKYILTALSALMLFAAPITQAEAQWEKPQIHEDIDYWLDMRYRLETVDQDGIAKDATASTLRARLGISYAPVEQLKFLLEMEANTPFGGEDYNNSINGKARPTIADPDSLELNRAQVAFTGVPDTTIIAGRQRVILDNARFVGNVGWRQNEQTFDSLVAVNTSLADTTLIAGHVWNVHRIFGSQSDSRKLDVTGTWLLNGKYTGFDLADITGYGYIIDVDEAATLSSQTFGARAVGKYDLNDAQSVLYTAEFAKQTDNASNTADLDAHYFLGELGFKHKALTLKAGYEELAGDGTTATAFQTPLATLHAHNGWADKFLTTPGDGLEDMYLKATYKYGVAENDVMGDIKMTAVYHDFSAENTGADYGHEIDLALSATFFDHYNVTIKYADYNEDGLLTDTEKVWFQIGTKF